MIVQLSDNGWDDYLHWHSADKKLLKRINALIANIRRDPFAGIGKPEPLRHALTGCWSRRINDEHRLVYQIHRDTVTVVAAQYHYTG